jgi:hypothetical protein
MAGKKNKANASKYWQDANSQQCDCEKSGFKDCKSIVGLLGSNKLTDKSYSLSISLSGVGGVEMGRRVYTLFDPLGALPLMRRCVIFNCFP